MTEPHDYSTLVSDFNRFTEIYSSPAEGIEFKNWPSLPDDVLQVWADRLNPLGEKVIADFREMGECRWSSDFQAKKAFFRDITETQHALKARGITLDFKQ